MSVPLNPSYLLVVNNLDGIADDIKNDNSASAIKSLRCGKTHDFVNDGNKWRIINVKGMSQIETRAAVLKEVRNLNFIECYVYDGNIHPNVLVDWLWAEGYIFNQGNLSSPRKNCCIS